MEANLAASEHGLKELIIKEISLKLADDPEMLFVLCVELPVLYSAGRLKNLSIIDWMEAHFRNYLTKMVQKISPTLDLNK